MTLYFSLSKAGQFPVFAKNLFSGRATRGLLGLAAVLCAAMPMTGRAQTTFSDPASIDIPKNTLLQGQASLYPSPVTVSGVGTSLTNLTVTFIGLSHAYPDDIDVLLVGPGGQNVLLMSDCGGYFPVLGTAPITLTFSDAAAALLGDETQLASGTFKPTNFDAPQMVDSFASPAPNSGPYGSTLSVFNGTNPNGVWNLYVIDDTQGNSGTMAGGWSLTVSATGVPEPSSLALGACALAGGAGWVLVRRRRLTARG